MSALPPKAAATVADRCVRFGPIADIAQLPACLIADVNMPAMTGIELYRHLSGTGRTIPTILVTAYPNDVERARALNDGVVCYLSKSVDEQHLKRCLHAALTSGE